jgi:hypothetical protein
MISWTEFQNYRRSWDGKRYAPRCSTKARKKRAHLHLLLTIAPHIPLLTSASLMLLHAKVHIY